MPETAIINVSKQQQQCAAAKQSKANPACCVMFVCKKAARLHAALACACSLGLLIASALKSPLLCHLVVLWCCRVNVTAQILNGVCAGVSEQQQSSPEITPTEDPAAEPDQQSGVKTVWHCWFPVFAAASAVCHAHPPAFPVRRRNA